jgi:hypothetical protein
MEDDWAAVDEPPAAPEPPSFRRRSDVRRLVLALVVPWLLMILAYSLPLLDRELHRAGHNTDWMRPVVLVWFYGLGFTSLFSLLVLMLFGIWRLVWRREYRHSWYGWSWAVLTWLNLCALSTVVTSKTVMLM